MAGEKACPIPKGLLCLSLFPRVTAPNPLTEVCAAQVYPRAHAQPDHLPAAVPEPKDLLMDSARQALHNWGDHCGAAGATRYLKHQCVFGEGPKIIIRHLANKPRWGCGGWQKYYNPIPEAGKSLEPLRGSLHILEPKTKSSLMAPWSLCTHQPPCSSTRLLLPSDTHFYFTILELFCLCNCHKAPSQRPLWF